MKISTVIPCYNCENYIEETLNSVLNQTHKDLQIICVDNNSTDATLKILQRMSIAHSSIEIYSEKRAGANYARNTGLMKADGVYLQFLDSDDYITPEKFEKQSVFIEEHNLDLLISDRKVFDIHLRNEIKSFSNTNFLEKPLQYSISNIITSGNPLYRTDFIKELGGYCGELESSQDWEFHIRIILKNPKVGYLKGYFFYSRTVTNSLSSNYIKVSNTSCEVIKKYKKEFIDNKVYENDFVRKKILFTYFISFLNASDSSHEYKTEFLFWYSISNGIKAFRGVNKILIYLVGIKNYLKLKKILKYFFSC